ncbi:MAG TPA: ABC transporter ATP-binding protein [Candidatus Eremiobacteraceae bacterium]|nr:ABC transporter ATP-binding protein [Candidatus Eremiobacteraceae bacterium]
MSLAADFSARRDGFALNFAIDVEAGETVAVVGQSGAGKTTALYCLAGLLRPDRGRICCDDHTWFDDSSRAYVPAHRRDVALVFARGALFGHMSAHANVEFGLRASGVAPSYAAARARVALDVVDGAHVAARPASMLSSGEVQRVALARAVALAPALLLLDEPLSALDIRLRPLVRDALRRAIAAAGAATVLVTHDPAEALLFARRFVVVEEGRVVQSGDIAALRDRPATPYVASFAGTNLYRGQARSLGDGSSDLQVDGVTLVVQGEHEGEISVVLDPDAVTLSATTQTTSARNVLHGPVESIVHDRGAFRVTLGSTPPIAARVTAHSLAALEIAQGTSLYATFKAMEARVL